MGKKNPRCTLFEHRHLLLLFGCCLCFAVIDGKITTILQKEENPSRIHLFEICLSMSGRRILLGLIAFFLIAVFTLSWKIRNQQDIAARHETLGQQLFLFGGPAAPATSGVGAPQDSLRASSSTPTESPTANSVLENRRHFVGAPQAKLTPLCPAEGNSGGSDSAADTWATRLVRASPFKRSPMCYYTVCNFCVTDGALEFFSPMSGAVLLSDLMTPAPAEEDDARNKKKSSKKAASWKRRGNGGDGEQNHAASTPSPVAGLTSAPRSRAEVSDTPPLRLCNELRAKISLPVLDADAIRRSAANVSSSPSASSSSSAALMMTLRELQFLKRRPTAADWIEERSAHVLSCWNFYGYHLFQCSVAAYYAEFMFDEELQRQRMQVFAAGNNNVSSVIVGKSSNNSIITNSNISSGGGGVNVTITMPFDLWLYNHAVTMTSALRNHFSHAMYLGSTASWLDPVREKAEKALLTEQELQDGDAVRPAPWWGLWAANALNGGSIIRLSRNSRSQQMNNNNRSSNSSAPTGARTVSDGPDRVHEIFRFPRRGTQTKQRMCYRRGIIGQPVHRVVPDEIRHRHIEILRKAFNVPEPLHLSMPEDMRKPDFTADVACDTSAPVNNSSSNNNDDNSSESNNDFSSQQQQRFVVAALSDRDKVPLRVIIVQRGVGKRQGSRRIQNVEAVVNAVEAVFRGQGHLYSANQDDDTGAVVALAGHGHHGKRGVTIDDPDEDAKILVEKAKAAEAEKLKSTKEKKRQRKLELANKAREDKAAAAAAEATARPAAAASSADDLIDQHLTEKLSALDSASLRLISRTRLEVEIIDFAAIPFDEQVKMASSADVMISTHGAANVWLSFMPRGRSVFVELWPQDYVARDVYRAMAMQYRIKYVPVFAGMKPLFGPKGSKEAANSFLHQDVRVPINKFAKLLQTEVAPYVLRAMKCRRRN